jgi:23S rRNA (adenine2503-C2)-methyltransferase
MGMGEPLANTRNVFRALTRINSDIGIGARHITISTVGIVPGIKLFASLGAQFNLAVSLHAANNEKRSSLVPINRRYPIELLTETLDSYFRVTRRRISFEWAMMDGVNDSDTDAKELISLCIPLEAHVNLIPLNPTPGWPTKGTPKTRVDEFARILENAGISASVRDNRGTGIDAACGQLAGTMLTRHSGERFYSDSSANIDVGDLLD